MHQQDQTWDQVRLMSTITLCRRPLPGQPHIDMQIQEGSCAVPPHHVKHMLCEDTLVDSIYQNIIPYKLLHHLQSKDPGKSSFLFSSLHILK